MMRPRRQRQFQTLRKMWANLRTQNGELRHLDLAYQNPPGKHSSSPRTWTAKSKIKILVHPTARMMTFSLRQMRTIINSFLSSLMNGMSLAVNQPIQENYLTTISLQLPSNSVVSHQQSSRIFQALEWTNP